MLYIYRASAGSGKTFLLTGFYIEMLFRKELAPTLGDRNLLFSEILAVTFTNKATAEMKERIIKDLNKLWKNPSGSAYYKKVRGEEGNGPILSDNEISRRAHEILTSMLTDYSSLHISTIDSFFQQVVRSFAHELNIQGNYEVELDADMVLDNAVSRFLLNLDPAKDKETFDWLLRFSNNRMQNGSNWNVHKELVKLAKVLTTEEYRDHSQRIQEFTSNKQEMSDYMQKLDEIVYVWRKKLVEIGTQINQVLKDCNLKAEEFSGKEKNISCALKWAQGVENCTATIRKWAEDPTKWFKGDDQNKLTEMGAKAATLQGLLAEGVALFSDPLQCNYFTALAIRKNFYQLGLLSRLEQSANDYCAEQGVKLLTDTTQMLNALVADQKAPFIYEKTGTRIMSYMIDEFQDTSGMQWNNFSPLLEESLGNGNRDLIVGDVKQSIYRWRGSDWNLLHEKLKHFEPLRQAKDDNNNELRDNWRSDEKIIRFNNQFFEFASKWYRNNDPNIPTTIEEIYADVAQTISEQRQNKYRKDGFERVPDGKVVFETLPDDKYDEGVVRRLPELVIALQQQGREAKDILILCRKRQQCNLCAKALLDYEASHPESPYSMKIITQEALLLYKHPVIRAIIAVLEYLHEPKSDYRRNVAGICWLALSTDSTSQAIADYFIHPDKTPDFDALLNLPLYETVERLIAMLPAAARQETNFIQALCDVVLSFCAKEGPNLDSFLGWWKDHGKKCSVTTPSEQPAIRIMTIHQSKGLSGKAVIVPFANDSLDIKINSFHPDILWCEPKEEGFARENLILPIIVDKRMKESIFRPDYEQERTRAIIDNLNTAYVAFTRAENELIILSPAPPKNPNASLPSFLYEFMNKVWKEGNDKIVLDTEAVDTAKSTSKVPTVQLPARITSTEEQRSLPLIKETEYIDANDSAQTRGTTLHAALSAVIDRNQVDGPITSLFRSGRAQLNGLELDSILAYVHRVLQTAEAGPWFDPANKVLNEQDIVTRSTHTHRPDRIVFTPDGRCIVIDYKTGSEDNGRYKPQVAQYMDYLTEMGFSKVEGYLWYLETGIIYPV